MAELPPVWELILQQKLDQGPGRSWQELEGDKVDGFLPMRQSYCELTSFWHRTNYGSTGVLPRIVKLIT